MAQTVPNAMRGQIMAKSVTADGQELPHDADRPLMEIGASSVVMIGGPTLLDGIVYSKEGQAHVIAGFMNGNVFVYMLKGNKAQIEMRNVAGGKYYAITVHGWLRESK
jgi:hypothetical protein